MPVRTRHTRLARQRFGGVTRRLGLVLAVAAVASVVGSGVSWAAGRSGAVRIVHFAFSQTMLSGKQTGGFAAGDTSESFPVVTCQWPDGKALITVAAARAVKCFPRGARFSVTAGRRWFLLD